MASSSSPTKKILIGLGVLLVLVVLLMVIGTATGALGGGPGGMEVETAEAQVRTVTQTVTASGKVQPEIEVKIASDVSGEIIRLTVEEGDRVERGQLLVQVQPEVYITQRDQARAGLLQAQADSARAAAELIRARTELDRQQALFERQAVSDADLVAARASADVAKANLDAASFRTESSRAILEQAATELRRTSIYAPMSGTVSQLNVEEGERVVGTAQFDGTELMRIAELTQMLLEVDINENDIVNIALADTARVEIDAYPEQPFHGVVTQIANSARVEGAGTQEQITNFPVEVRIVSDEDSPLVASQPGEIPTAPTAQLRPGMSGTVDVFTETVPNAIVVPIQAVTVRDFNNLERADEEGGDDGNESEDGAEGEATPVNTFEVVEEDLRRIVFVVRDGKAEIAEVVTGIADDTYIEIRSGLQAGDQVITGPFRALRTELKPGQTVEIGGGDSDRRGRRS
ncbi:MAG: efflux RND transporter periplasmic adaptor subunit [Bacteroidota bacterium]